MNQVERREYEQIAKYLYEKVRPDGPELFKQFNGTDVFYFLDVGNLPLTCEKIRRDLGWTSAKVVRHKIHGLCTIDGVPKKLGVASRDYRPIFFRFEDLSKFLSEFNPASDKNQK